MDVEKLRYFRVVAKEEHMTRAAQKINITQPSLSSIIANMESELGVKLFERVGRQIVLNKYGKVFYKGVDDMLDTYDHILTQIESMKTENDCDVNVAVTGLNFPRRIIASFAEEFPQLRINMRLIRADEIDSTLKHSEAGIVLSIIESTSEKIKSEKLFEERLCLMVPADDPLAEMEEVSLADVKDKSFAMTPSNTAYRVLLDRIFKQAGFEPKIAIEGYTEQLLQMVIERSAVSVITESDAKTRCYSEKIKCVRLKDEFCKRAVYMLTRSDVPLSENELSFCEFVNYEKAQYVPDTVMEP